MNYLESNLSKREYLLEIKRSFDNPFLIFDERLCGMVIGSFFSVAYHSPYEWNRRITSECNRAWGWVKETEGKTEVRFLRGKGLFSPFWLIFYTLFCFCLFSFHSNRLIYSEEPNAVLLILGISAVISVVVCGITAFQSSITEAGEEGAGEITRLLQNPKEYY